jgi:hypothetical protein
MPGQVLSVPEGLRLSVFLDNRHLNVVRLLALCNGLVTPPGNIPGTHSVIG